MTEEEWLVCTDPPPMIECVRRKASDRKFRLLAVACCRRIWNLLPVACQAATDVFELYADRLVTDAEYHAACKSADAEAIAADRDSPDTLTYATASVGISDPPTVPSVSSVMDTAATAVACAVAENALDGEYDVTHDAARKQEVYEQIRLVRDIFGNPFHLITIDSTLFTLNVIALAQAIYDERAFDRMPELAAALVEAGCDDHYILNHCRNKGPHVRGCWVVDLVLGKE